jgi:hypothetical protein
MKVYKECVMCWEPTKWLRCKKCLEKVDEEIVKREISRPMEFYFRNYYKKQKSDK